MIALQAIFSKATTTVDGGWNVTFSTAEHMGKEITELSKLREEGLFVVVMTEQEYEAQQVGAE